MSDRIQNAVLNTVAQLHIVVVPADLHQTLVIKEEASEEWRPGVDQQDPESFHIKEEQEEMREETDATWCSITGIHLKSEDDEEKPLLSELHQDQDEDLSTSSSADGGECGRAETTRNSDQITYKDDFSSSETDDSEDYKDGSYSDSQLRLVSDSGSETEDSDSYWKESRTPESGVNTVNKSISCSESDEQLVNNTSLQRHETRHSTIMSSSCLGNEERFRVKNYVDSQKQVQVRPKSFSCEDCGKTFARKDYLSRHIRIHTGQKPFSCHVCERRFRNKEHLNRHMIIHTGQKPFGCDVCERRFSFKTDFNIHMRIHTGHKPFCCDACGRRFCSKSSLIKHMRIHTGQKPLGCEVCQRRFNCKADLNTHMRIHTGQKPFVCDVCERRFSYKSNLNTHMRIHTGHKPFGCDVCERRFSDKGNYNRHMKIHTGNTSVICTDS